MGAEERKGRMSSQIAFVAAKKRDPLYICYIVGYLSYSMLSYSYYSTIKIKTRKFLFFYSHAEYPSLMANKKKPSSSTKFKPKNVQLIMLELNYYPSHLL